jgi:hypothetical protein
LVKLAGIAQGASEAVMRLNMSRIGGYGGAKCLRGFFE